MVKHWLLPLLPATLLQTLVPPSTPCHSSINTVSSLYTLSLFYKHWLLPLLPVTFQENWLRLHSSINTASSLCSFSLLSKHWLLPLLPATLLQTLAPQSTPSHSSINTDSSLYSLSLFYNTGYSLYSL